MRERQTNEHPTGESLDAVTGATCPAEGIGAGGDVDAVTAATSLADAAAALDPAREKAPLPACAPPGVSAASAGDVDAATGATPGVASACRELGMASVDDVVRERGIKPPGMA
ncbi:hypothetical protein C1878_16310 [Gordonibacter sp. 28C]|uniref:hypothetical protein n=1 Tax=Gordonibacter sp. 28C TaxID=2078569 RepID=UPI000DF86A34|nr:hypothetical protein [Gordonibacter sp. 28C]RDB58491.1 hypothetical protein C1878_16310 [Gordonibacter sp. 28C]